MAANFEGAGVLYGQDEKAEVLRQLDRLLGNPHLSHSKRFPSFLRFIVQEELEGRGDQLKERTLGVQVFGRDASYDTTSDPIVRVTATEIRTSGSRSTTKTPATQTSCASPCRPDLMYRTSSGLSPSRLRRHRLLWATRR